MPETKSNDAEYKSKSTLKELYVEQDMTQAEIAEQFGVDTSTISYWVNKYDFDTSVSVDRASFLTTKDGYEIWSTRQKRMAVHRLLAVAEHGIEAVKGMDVHHCNHIPWDNRAENIELKEHREHGMGHSQQYWGVAD